MSGTAAILSNNVTLTASYVASTISAPIHGASHHTLFITYAPDTNSTNAINVQIDVSHDGGTTWHVYGQYTNSSGTLSEQAYTISDTSAGTADQDLVPIVFEATGTHLRLRALETNTPGAYGEYTATLRSRSS